MVRDLRTLVWLASYPKSGNTWLRAFLGNYLFKREEPLSLNDLKRVSSGDAPAAAYRDIAGRPPQGLHGLALMQVRTKYLHRIATQADISFVKTHSANVRIQNVPLIPPQFTRMAIYVVRNPLDMLVSFADHFAMSFERAAEAIATKTNGVPPNQKVLGQYLGTWSDHVKGWTRAKDIRVHTVRYEDMQSDPEQAFSRVIKAMGVPVDDAALRQAIEFSSFETLKRLESETGFDEKGAAQERFFREGRTGTGSEALPPAVIEKIKQDHGDTMRRHGYL